MGAGAWQRISEPFPVLCTSPRAGDQSTSKVVVYRTWLQGEMGIVTVGHHPPCVYSLST